MTPSELTQTTNSVAGREDEREIVTDECRLQVCQIQSQYSLAMTLCDNEIMHSLTTLDINNYIFLKSIVFVVLVLHLRL